MLISAGCAEMSDFANITAGSRVYVDSNIFIYFIETDGLLQQKVREIFEFVQDRGARLVTSEMTLAECIFQPARENNAALVQKYELLLEDIANVEPVPLVGGIVKLAAMRGGIFGLKLIDSIHLVSALESGCDFFLTNDRAFRSGQFLEVIHVAA